MKMQALVKRKTIPITFSREFEALLLSSDSDHISLTQDIEYHALQGLDLLEELEDVHDLKHVEAIKLLIEHTNQYATITSKHFSQWHLNISEDLLDEVDLLLLAHGDDLKILGLRNTTQGTVLVLLALAAIKQIKLQ